MRQWHELLIDAVNEERERLASRRDVLAGGAKVVGAGAAAVTFAGMPRAAFAQDATPVLEVEQDFEDDLDVLNYALTLKHLEHAFYRDGIDLFDFGADPFGVSINERLALIRDHEAAHVATLTEVIIQLGGEPVDEQQYDFGVLNDAVPFLEASEPPLTPPEVLAAVKPFIVGGVGTPAAGGTS